MMNKMRMESKSERREQYERIKNGFELSRFVNVIATDWMDV
jgi:hypothetical protein